MLTSDQLAMVASVDKPEVSFDAGMRLRTNIGESAPTHIEDGSVAYVFTCFELKSSGYRLFDAVSGEISPISREDFVALTTAATPSEARVCAARRLLTPMSSPRWRFPDLDLHSKALRSGIIRTLMINTIEQCNIRCTYCYYGGAYDETRVHQNARPGSKGVRDVIDMFLATNADANGAARAIYFFGGEPLLNFGLIEETVEYFYMEAEKSGLDVSNVIIQVNTNGMLLRRNMVEFFARYGVFMNFSIDGPNHDRFRIDARGRGTLSRVRAKLDWMYDNFPKYVASRVALVCVVSPPANVVDLYDYFANWKAACGSLHLDFDLLFAGGSLDYDEQDLARLKEDLWELFVSSHGRVAAERSSSMIEWFATGFNFLHTAFHRALVRDDRVAVDGRIGSLIGIQGLPGLFFAMLGADEKLYATFEFQSAPFVVGDASTGIDVNEAAERGREIRQVAEASSCRTCWAARMCNMDYPNVPFTSRDSLATTRRKALTKVQQCVRQRADLKRALVAVEDVVHHYGASALEYDRRLWRNEVDGGNRPSDVF